MKSEVNTMAYILVITVLLIFGAVGYSYTGGVDIEKFMSSLSLKTESSSDIESLEEETPKAASTAKKSKKSTKKAEPVYKGVGLPIDSFNRVLVYYNGGMGHVDGRNVTADGYNLGLKYQCVEFIKRYYYEYFNFKMPNTYGHAKEYFDSSLPDGGFNAKRGLIQFENAGTTPPKVNDIVVFGPTAGNSFGHIAIVSRVLDGEIEIIQQNVGKQTRVRFPLVHFESYWTVAHESILGWLRLP